MGLDYSHAGQRDWQGPCLAVAGLLIAQGWSGRPGRVASAVLIALGFSIRPQVVLFLPALLLAVATSGASKAHALRRGAFWLATFAVFAALAFLPLAIDGTFADFLHSLRHVAFGSTYNKTTPASVARAWLIQGAAFRWLVVPAAIPPSYRQERVLDAGPGLAGGPGGGLTVQAFQPGGSHISRHPAGPGLVGEPGGPGRIDRQVARHDRRDSPGGGPGVAGPGDDDTPTPSSAWLAPT